MQLIKDASAEKLRGAYYTPSAIASFILHWGINGGHDADILEPSCGDGVFLECMRDENMFFHTVTAVEYETTEAEKARALGLHNSEVINQDFHKFCLDTDKRFDLVVGNPPFIRYQYYDSAQQKLADEIFKNAKLKRTKLTNAWVTFVVGCTQLLRDNGKMGFVIPSELLMVKYAQQLRKYLAKTFNKINIISFENLVFEEIQQEVVLLLCEKNGTNEHKIEHIEVKDTEGLLALDPHQLKFPSKDIDFQADKWTYYFLDKKELDLLDKVKIATTISTFANVEVGITTGSNDFFTVPQSIVSMYQLDEYARPMVGRSVQVNSLCFTKRDWKTNVASDARAHLLVFTPDAKETGNDAVKAYLESGEAADIDKGYKTSIRDQWWVIPSIKVSDALFLRRNNLYPKFVLNEVGAYTTDTMHRVFIKEGVNKKAFVASYYNSLSFAFAEILGRNFGGGCLELMPSEVGGIYLPYREENEQIFDTLDSMLRKKATADEILDYSDEIILHQGMGLSLDEVKLARSIWHKIINRRLTRETLEKPAEKKVTGNEQYTQLSLFELFEQYGEKPLVENSMLHESADIMYGVSRTHLSFPIDLTKNLLICNVKKDNWKQYLDGSATIYYTGKKFPTTVALNKLYYFMPYLSGKGIRDLYYIKIARLGCRKEGQPGEDINDIRLVFEIERLGELFDDYKKVSLEIWRTFTDTTVSEVMKMDGIQPLNFSKRDRTIIMKIEKLKDFVQSANVNFLIGSGLSCPFLPTLKKIEEQLATVKNLPEEKREGVTASIYREYFEKVIAPNLIKGRPEAKYLETLDNYKEFLNIWNAILHNRCTSLRSKQANIYSTNIDLMVEKAVEAVAAEFNDGFIGSVMPVFNEANFQKTVRKESAHFQNSAELPVFNLMKMHGSVNWKNVGDKIINDYNLSLISRVNKVIGKYAEGIFPQYYADNAEIAKQIEVQTDFSDFTDAYNQFQIVNPTKRKFSETVMDMHFYELMRMFSNSLERENSLLFVMGFSFADEHIRSIVKRALKTNPTLVVIVFAHEDNDEDSYRSKFEENFSNLMIVTPSNYNEDNSMKEESKIDKFDFKSVNKVFQELLNLIPVRFGDGR